MELLVMLSLFLLIRSDFQNRWIRSDTLLIFGILQLILACWRTGYEMVLTGILYNCFLLLSWGGGVLLFYTIRHRRLILSLKKKLGTGDFCFLLCLTPVFDTKEFILFLLIGFLVSLGYGCFSSWLTGRSQTIPLVATLGCCYVVLLVKKLIIHYAN